MIHYHGTPISPRSKMQEMQGRHFCLSWAYVSRCKNETEEVLKIAQSVMFDNGAFTAFTKGKPLDMEGFTEWVDEFVQHPHWCVIPDVIGGDVEQQRKMINSWDFPTELSAPVWHLGLPLDWLLELCDNYPKVCFGSSAEYWQVGSPPWRKRMDEAFEMLTKTRKHLPWLHGMRMLGQSGDKWPLASADSSNIARHHAELRISPEVMAQRIDAVQPVRKWVASNQLEIILNND
jgi:hypothetical protein